MWASIVSPNRRDMSNIIQFPGADQGSDKAKKANFKDDLINLVLNSISDDEVDLVPCVLGRINTVLDKYGDIPRREISFNFSETLSADDESHLHQKITDNYGEFIGGYVQPMLVDLCFAQIALCRAEMLIEEKE